MVFLRECPIRIDRYRSSNVHTDTHTCHQMRRDDSTSVEHSYSEIASTQNTDCYRVDGQTSRLIRTGSHRRENRDQHRSNHGSASHEHLEKMQCLLHGDSHSLRWQIGRCCHTNVTGALSMRGEKALTRLSTRHSIVQSTKVAPLEVRTSFLRLRFRHQRAPES